MLGAPNESGQTETVSPGHSDRFCRAQSSSGPHPIPRRRQISNQFHRLHSIKAGHRVVSCESPLEADAVIWAESNPDVVAICEQPLRIEEPLRAKPSYTFDIGLRFRNGQEWFYEVKPFSSLAVSPDGRLLPVDWPLIEAWCAANGFRCDVITDETLRPFIQCIDNWRALLPFAATAYADSDPVFEASLLTHITSSDVTTLAAVDMAEGAAGSEHVTAHLAKLLHEGRVSSDINSKPLSPQTKLWMTTHA